MRIVMLIILTPIISTAQNTKDVAFVCTPCGYACDSIEYKSPGACPTCNMEFVDKATVSFENITFAKMCDRVSANRSIILLDVRSPGEFNGESEEINSFGHFKDAININVSDIESRLTDLEPFKNEEIIVYCSHSHRSPRASYILTKNGFNHVANVVGGVSILSEQFGNNECLNKLFVKH